MKKTFRMLLSFLMVIILSMPAFAAVPGKDAESKDYKEYLQLVSDGVLGEEVSFEYWQDFKARSAQLESALENSKDFYVVYDSASTRSAGYSMRAGDVFVTNATSFFGFTGHSGIAISSTQILHIAGKGHHPATISLNSWNSSYTSKGWTKVYRHKSSSVAMAAAKWAKNTYAGSNATYAINFNTESTHETYCSKIVWQAYRYGPTTSSVANNGTHAILSPYDLHFTIRGLSKVADL